MVIQSLASGSGGNAVFIATDNTRILVDVGLSLPRLQKRLANAQIDPATIDAVLITHEHSDHIIGLESFMKRFNPTLHVHSSTVDLFSNIPTERICMFDGCFDIGDIRVTHFPVPHDSKFCFGYSFTNGDAKISLATDLGRMTEDIMANLAGSQIVMLECNHDLLRLTSNKKYPLKVKRRIIGSQGHLSNPSCALAIYRLVPTGVSQIILGHISEDNNSPQLAYNFVKDFLGAMGIIEGTDVWIDVALQDEPSKRFDIH